MLGTTMLMAGAGAAPSGQFFVASNLSSYATGNFIVPAGVTEISAFLVGGGGSGGVGASSANGGSGDHGGAGGGSGTLWVSNIPVTPGQVIPYSVGYGGQGQTTWNANGNDGKDTWLFNSITIRAFGGNDGKSSGVGGAQQRNYTCIYPNFGVGYGGQGGDENSAPGGGGAGGYGVAGNNTLATGGSGDDRTNGTDGANGGGGGGGGGNGLTNGGANGGGVGMWGRGNNGAGGASRQAGGSGSVYAGNPGYYGYGTPGMYQQSSSRGGRGALRIVWGPGREYPGDGVNPIPDV